MTEEILKEVRNITKEGLPSDEECAQKLEQVFDQLRAMKPKTLIIFAKNDEGTLILTEGVLEDVAHVTAASSIAVLKKLEKISNEIAAGKHDRKLNG